MKSKIGKGLVITGCIIGGIILFAVSLGIVFGTENNSYYPSHRDDVYSPEMNESITSGKGSSDSNLANKIVTNNRISIETKNINKAIASLEALIESNGGKVISKNMNLGDEQYGYISIKIPSDKGKKFVEEINDKFDVSSYNTDISDVTDQYINTEKEIENLKRKIKLYNELATKTPISEISTHLTIVDEIFELEKQILLLQESNELIDKKVEYRDVHITLSAPDKIQGERNYWRNVGQTIISTFQGSLKLLIVLVTVSVPFIIVIGIPIFIAIKFNKKELKKSK